MMKSAIFNMGHSKLPWKVPSFQPGHKEKIAWSYMFCRFVRASPGRHAPHSAHSHWLNLSHMVHLSAREVEIEFSLRQQGAEVNGIWGISSSLTMHLKGNSILGFCWETTFPLLGNWKYLDTNPRGQGIVLTIKAEKINKMKKSKTEKLQPSSYLGRAVSFHFWREGFFVVVVNCLRKQFFKGI